MARRAEGDIVADADALAKQTETLRARCALAGFGLHPLADGTFMISRWDKATHLQDAACVRAWLTKMGVK